MTLLMPIAKFGYAQVSVNFDRYIFCVGVEKALKIWTPSIRKSIGFGED